MSQISLKELELLHPGFSKPQEQSSHLPTAQKWYASPLTVRERTMLGLILSLKDKPEWDRKVFDEEIVAKWRKEALDFTTDRKGTEAKVALQNGDEEDTWNVENHNGEGLNLDGKERQKEVSEKMFDYCIAELRDDAKRFQERGFTSAIDANACVYMSDTAIRHEVKNALRVGVQRLENVKEWQRDWHPGSDGKVLDLVHPSLFPLLYGRSRILPSGKVPLKECALSTGKGLIFPRLDMAEDTDYSANFQWLPCEALLATDGKVKIESYINNLYPTGNEDLYTAIEEVITASIPLWIETIISTQFLATHRIKQDFGQGRFLPPEAIETRQRRREEHERQQEEYEKRKEEDPDNNDLEEPEDYYSDHSEDYEISIPEPRKYKIRQRVEKEVFILDEEDVSGLRLNPHTEPRTPYISATKEQREDGRAAIEQERQRIRSIFQEKGLQVIVKLANIHLTPDKPTYDGGSWHIEGQLNEHIVASALYYYDSENINDSYLAFREGADKDELSEYDQYAFNGLTEIYGINEDWGEAIQNLGSVNTREDRLLVFPNVLQHHVSPFELVDKDEAGHRKLLALFLVDPFIRIPSTANVPPQQRDWWKKAMEEKDSLTQRVPVELADMIVEDVEDFPITLEEAKKLRETLIEERKAYVEESMEPYRGEWGYSFCEH